ncbi:hypothetical protein [Polaromonas aquatica]|uniref:hypothetical protein n=1 Tax=Polaromonas aquatica TaxID=332657 RepID=UPI003D649F0E
MRAFKSGSSFVIVAALLAAGCAFTPVKPGMTREEVFALRGTPSRVLPLDAGTRLQYSGQPLGQFATMIDLDASGRVVSVREVLTPAEFSRVQPGKWTRADMEREFGRPARIDRVASWSGDIMTYRWRDNDQPMFFWAYLDGNNVIQRTGQGMEFPLRVKDR